MFSHLRRIAISLIFFTAIAVLALVIDGVVVPFYDLGAEHGVSDGPFGMVHDLAGSIMFWIIPIFILGIVAWILVGPIQRTRREEEQRRLR